MTRGRRRRDQLAEFRLARERAQQHRDDERWIADLAARVDNEDGRRDEH